jgi:prepilin-type N-terminal cleavage/methylation domain-containing protein
MPIKPTRGFTLVELLIVIAIISILVGVTVVVTGSVMNRATSTKDMGNHRIIGSATWSHSVDNKGSLLHPRVYSNGENPGAPDNSTLEQIARFWVNADPDELDSDGNPRVVDVSGYTVELQSALKDGAAYPYIGDMRVYQSPLDPTIGDLNEFVATNTNLKKQRIRSYSLNGFVGVEWGADDYEEYRDSPPLRLEANGYWIPTETVSQIPQPSNTMCSIGENEKDGRNNNGWILNPSTEQWVDFPSFWDEGRVNMSFIDGSTGSIKITSDTLKEKWEQFGHDQITSDLQEYKDFRKVLLPGLIGTMLDN